MQIDQNEFETIIQSHLQQKESLIPILQDIQAKFNYLPPVSLNMVSQTLGIPLIDIISVASFYNAFSLVPKGKHQVTVCTGTACHVRGAPKILDEFERILGIEAGSTTKDMRFSLDKVACLGCCAIGPVVVADAKYHAQSNIRQVDKLINKYNKEDQEEKE